MDANETAERILSSNEKLDNQCNNSNADSPWAADDVDAALGRLVHTGDSVVAAGSAPAAPG